jgi:ABC-type uncharacterized transport system ATPase subunit
MTAPGFAIELQQLTLKFGDLTAVDHLDLQVPYGVISGCWAPTAPASPRRSRC